MNAHVEVETAQVAVLSTDVEITALLNVIAKVKTPVVSTSTLRVISQGSHSISAVAPDYIFEGGLPAAA